MTIVVLWIIILNSDSIRGCCSLMNVN